MQLDNEKTNEISLALIEACINAFEHSESKSEVFIHFIISDESLTIKVIDKGKGFDSSKISIPNIENKLGSDEKKRGWGIMLIKELMDSVNFESNDQGTTLTMIKNKDINE
jgi:serine/threonine-protein kinase RsbW